MFEKLKNSRDARLTAAIAAGVFGGLLAYRLFIWAREWWIDLSSDNQTTLIQIAVGSVIAGLIFYGLRRLFNRDKYRRIEAAAPTRFGLRTASRLQHAFESTVVAFFLFGLFLTDITPVPLIVALCAVTLWLVARIRARMRRAEQAQAEIERRRQIQREAENLESRCSDHDARKSQLERFLKWMRLAEDEGTPYLSADSVMNDRESQQVFESLRCKSTEELLDIVVRNDRYEWTDVTLALARQIILYRAQSPDFTETMDRFKASFVHGLAR